MKEKVWKVLSYVLVALVAACTTIVCFLFAQRANATKLDEVQALLKECYIGEINQGALEDAAAAAMIQSLGDEWSYYMTAEQYQQYLETASNSYVGVGVTVQAREDQQGLDIIEVTKGSSAAEVGIQTGDRLIQVGDTSIADMSINDVGAMIRGEEGTTVELTVVREGQILSFTVERRRIQSVVASGRLLEDGVGLVTIENFDDRCAEETIAAVNSLLSQGANALVFDVRNNPGGYKHELVKVLDYLLPEGEVFRSVDYTGKEEIDRSDASCVEIPMAVLVNLHSYSAAEFFAAALDDYDAAIVVGEKTYGKGYFQSAFRLSDGSAVNLSIGKYYTPKGKSLAGVGLTPDVEIPVDKETEAVIYMGQLEPEEDPQLQAAIKALNG
ncbi:MAG: S41 family peptidase [Oscillospiraceae bacterium]|nr:S41 family peptidase [Oscillospiraceae bacterium]